MNTSKSRDLGSACNALTSCLSLFRLCGPVNRFDYLCFGFGLSGLKYLVEFAVVYMVCDRWYTPIDFLNPFLSGREEILGLLPTWLAWGWLIWTLPFLWIGLSMSVRRAFDAGLSPWIGLVILVPFVNVVSMLILASIPSANSVDKASKRDSNLEGDRDAQTLRNVEEIYQPPSMASEPIVRGPSASSAIASALYGAGAGVAYLLISVTASVYLLDSYGAAMFFGAPIIMCAVSSFIYNYRFDRGLAATLAHSVGTLLLAALCLLFFALEGAICIVMAIPIFAPIGLMGTLVGYSIAVSLNRSRSEEWKGLLGCMAVLPFIAMVEKATDMSPVLEARSQIEIDAPIQVVWNHVIHFSDITDPPVGILSTGIAFPIRARIDGHGVGAVRYCEFNTGAFVEPITQWNEPTLLSFDVTQQPEPMSELSPYRHIHPPHLDSSFKSVRGEFRLLELTKGKTRLEGSTWYHVDLGPRTYWRFWTDWIVHRIHDRVLLHIKKSSETR